MKEVKTWQEGRDKLLRQLCSDPEVIYKTKFLFDAVVAGATREAKQETWDKAIALVDDAFGGCSCGRKTLNELSDALKEAKEKDI